MTIKLASNKLQSYLAQGPNEKEAGDYILLYTLPIFSFKGEANRKNFQGQFTGILISLAKQYFVLTAGHCLKDFRDETLHFGIARSADEPYKPKFLLRCDYRYDYYKGIDWGFIEISESDAASLKAQTKSFLPPGKLVVATRVEVEEKISSSLMCGFPSANTQHLPNEQGLGVRALAVLLSNPEKRSEPKVEASNLEMPSIESDVQIINYGGNPDAVSSLSGSRVQSIPMMEGASGGGFWSADFSDPIEQWDASMLRLLGIHVGEAVLDGETNKFRGFRTILIGHHLRFIAESIPALRELIYSFWPGLSEDLWNPQ